MNEKRIIQFLSEIEKLKSILRHNWTSTGRQESSAEHSWRIAIFFIIVNELADLGIDVVKTLKMILIHDIPEIHHGDIPGFIKDIDSEKHRRHKARENEVAEQIFSILPQSLSQEFLQLYNEFEAGKTKEAKVAKALDKIESQLQHLESGPKYWSKEERGSHMLHYPDDAVNKLGNSHISNIWKIIYEELKHLSY